MTTSTIKLSSYTIVALSVWAVSVVAIGAGYLFFSLPQTVRLTQVQKQCAETQTELEKAQLAARDETQEKMKSRCEQTSGLISEFAAEHDRMTELVFKVGQIANDLRLVEFSSKNEKKNDRLTIANSKTLDEGWLKVTFFATFNQFAEFINRLERHSPVVFVEEVSFRRGTSSSKGHSASLRLSFLAEKDTGVKKVASAEN